jgi:hypothetical protein
METADFGKSLFDACNSRCPRWRAAPYGVGEIGAFIDSLHAVFLRPPDLLFCASDGKKLTRGASSSACVNPAQAFSRRWLDQALLRAMVR